MFNKYFLLLVSLVAAVHIPATNANALCACYCCVTPDCTPQYEGTTVIQSCDGLNCYKACMTHYPRACVTTSGSEVNVRCTDEPTTTIPTTSTASLSTSSSTTTVTTATATTSTVTPWPTSKTTPISSTTTTITTSPDTSTVTTATASTQTTSTANITVTATTEGSTSSSSTGAPTQSTTTHNGVFIGREIPSFITLLVTSILVITKIIL